MSLKIDRVQLQFEIKPDYDQQQLQKLEEDLKKANRALNQTEREIEKVRKQKPSDPAEYKKWQKNLQDLNKKYQEQVTAVQNAQKAIDKHVEEMKLENLSMSQLTKRAQTLNTILRNLNPNSPAYQQYKQQLDAINARIKELKGQAVSTRLSLSKLADGFNRYSMLVGSAIASLTGLTLTIRKCTNAYAQMEDVMASVRKYTGQTDEQVRDMNEDFKKMDTRSSREQLNALAGAAGRLGLTAKEDIMAFVDGADKIGVALGDDLGEGAVDTIGKLAIAFGENDRLGLRGAMLATGSALNEIVQNSPAQAQPVVEFTEKLSGVGQQAHLTQAQIMGFAAALDQNNQEMATSSTVMSQLITKMYQDPARFANMAGIEVKKFTELVKTDMNQALVEWMQHVHQLGDMSVLAGKFDELKMDGTRAVGVLSTLAGHIDQVVEAQRIATAAYEEGTSVITEFNVQNTTVAAEIDKARKRFADLTIELGQKLMPIARHAITTGSAGIRILSRIVDFTSSYRTAILAATATLAAFIVVEKAHVVQQKLIAFWSDKVVAGTKKLWALLAAHPYAAVAGAIAVVVGLLIDLARRNNDVAKAEQMLRDIRTSAVQKMGEEEAKIQTLIRAAQDETASLKDRQSAVNELNRIIPNYNAQLDATTGKYIASKKALDDYLASLTRQYEIEGAKDMLSKLGKEAAEARLAVADAEKAVANAATATGQQYSSITGITGNTASDIRRHARENLDAAKKSLEQVEKQQQRIYDSFGKDLYQNATGSAKAEAAVVEPVTPSTPTLSDKERKKLLREQEAAERKEQAEARKRQKEAEDLAKADLQKADLEAKQAYQQRLITEEDYHNRRYQNEQAFIGRMAEIRDNQYATEAEKQEVQNMALDSAINEANYQQELRKKQLQQTLEAIDQSYAADQIALEQQRMSGEFASEREYQQKKIEAEIDYQRQRLAIIKAAGGDTLEAEAALNQALLKQFTDEREQSLSELQKAMSKAEKVHDWDAQLELQKQALAARLISQEQYEENVTAITQKAEQDRQQIRDTFAQQAQQLLQSTSSLFSALQSREESRVDAKYKKLIASAKKQGRDTTKLEEQQEAEKQAIKKKYADKGFALTVLQIIAQTALGIQKIWAEWGWQPTVAAALSATEAAVGAVQLATAKAQRDQAAGLYKGGYSDEYAEGYTESGNPKEVAGVIPVHKREFVINHEALQVPAVRRVADVIDTMQKRRSYSMQNTTAELQQAVATGGLATGGYNQQAQTTVQTVGVPASNVRLEQLMERNNALLDEILDSGITLLELRRNIRRQEQLEKNASR